MDSDLGGRPVRGLIPVCRNRNELAMGVARRDVGDYHMRQCPGMMQLSAAAFEPAFIGELAQHALERRAVGVLHAEGAGNLARAYFSRPAADECDKIVF